MKTFINKFLFITCAVFLLGSCAKDSLELKDFSSAIFINASPGTPPVSITVDTADVFSNGNLSSPLSHTGSTTYQGFEPGSHRITFLNQATSGFRTIFADLLSENFETRKAYTYFMYDTLINNRAKILRLNDEIKAPTAGNVRLRFVHLAKAVGPVDITFIRGTNFIESPSGTTRFIASTTAADSVTFSNINYVGDSPDANALSAFREIAGSSGINAFTATVLAVVPQANINNRYLIKVKQAGTQTIIAQNVSSGLPSTNTLLAGRVYTIYLSGSVKGVTTNFNVIQHFQF